MLKVPFQLKTRISGFIPPFFIHLQKYLSASVGRGLVTGIMTVQMVLMKTQNFVAAWNVQRASYAAHIKVFYHPLLDACTIDKFDQLNTVNSHINRV